jgi:hypothetical protein
MESSNQEIIQPPLKLTKICKKCSVIKFVECFYEVKGKDCKRKYYSSYCTPCETIIRTETNIKRRERHPLKERKIRVPKEKPIKIPKEKPIKIPKEPKVKIIKEQEPKPPKEKPKRTDDQRLHRFNKLSPETKLILIYLDSKNLSPTVITKIISNCGEEIKYKTIHYLLTIKYLPKWNKDDLDKLPASLKDTLDKLNIEII